MRTVLILLLLSPVLGLAEGGIQAVPPWPNQLGQELLSNGDLESLSDWSVGACAQAAPGAGVGGSAAIAISGDCRALSQARISMPDPDLYPWVEVTMQVRKSATAKGELTVSFRDLTHAGYFAPASSAFATVMNGAGAITEGLVTPGGDYIEIYRLLAVNRRHWGENWRLDLNSRGVSSGQIYVDRVSIRPAWYPLYNFVKYPSYHGYLWSGEDSSLCPGDAAEEACGFVDVVPPAGETLATVQVTVRRASEPGCETPAKTATILPAEKRTRWRIDASDMADNESAYICAQLVRKQDGRVLAGFPDWKIVKRTTAWRAANLPHWIDDYGRWRDGDVPRFLWMTYQRFSGANCSNCVWDQARGGKQAYLNVRGFNVPTRRSNWRPVEGQPPPTSVWYDFLRSGRNVSLYFSPFSGASPRRQTDQVTPWMDALKSLGLKYLHITNQYQGSVLGGDGAGDENESPAAPTVSCQPGGGAISEPYVHVKVSGVSGNNGLVSQTRLEESLASASTTAAALPANSNGSCVVTPPVCTGQQIGYWVYAKGSASAAPPPSKDFSLQSTRFIACGESAPLSGIIASGKTPLTSAFGSEPGQTSRRRPWWMTDEDSDIDALAEVADRAEGRNELLGYYICDECTAYDIGRNFRQVEYLRQKDPGRMVMALPMEVRSLAGVDWFFSPVVDINSQDIYYEGQNLGDDVWAQGHSKGRPTSCYSIAGSNEQRTVPNANLNKVDLWVDDKMRSHDGSRFNLPVVMQWARNSQSCFGWTLSEMRKQLWKAVIGVQNWGIVGGVGTWGWVSVTGLDRMAKVPEDGKPDNNPKGESVGNTMALEDDIRAGQELMAVEPMLLAPIADSTQRGFGQVLSAQPSSNLTLPTATCSGYTDPVRAVAKQLPDGRQWIMATNLCQDSQTITFRLAALPADAVVQDYFTGLEIPLKNGEFSVSSTDFDVHAFLVGPRSSGESAGPRRERSIRP